MIRSIHSNEKHNSNIYSDLDLIQIIQELGHELEVDYATKKETKNKVRRTCLVSNQRMEMGSRRLKKSSWKISFDSDVSKHEGSY